MAKPGMVNMPVTLPIPLANRLRDFARRTGTTDRQAAAVAIEIGFQVLDSVAEGAAESATLRVAVQVAEQSDN